MKPLILSLLIATSALADPPDTRSCQYWLDRLNAIEAWESWRVYCETASNLPAYKRRLFDRQLAETIREIQKSIAEDLERDR